MLLAEIARRGSNDCSFADYNFAVLLERLPDVFFAYEVGRLYTGRAVLAVRRLLE